MNAFFCDPRLLKVPFVKADEARIYSLYFEDPCMGEVLYQVFHVRTARHAL